MVKFNMYENPFSSWAYNVIDEFKPLTQEQIKTEVAKRTLPISILMSNIQGDFNFSSVIRNANAFGARNIYYIGNKKFDRRGTMGVMHYSTVTYLKSMQELIDLKSQYSFVAADNVDGAKPIETFNWSTAKSPLVIIGEESVGIPQEIFDLADVKVSIKQRGSVRSLNAATAAGIILYDFCAKYTKP